MIKEKEMRMVRVPAVVAQRVKVLAALEAMSMGDWLDWMTKRAYEATQTNRGKSPTTHARTKNATAAGK